MVCFLYFAFSFFFRDPAGSAELQPSAPPRFLVGERKTSNLFETDLPAEAAVETQASRNLDSLPLSGFAGIDEIDDSETMVLRGN
jgi:hypothetical protein